MPLPSTTIGPAVDSAIFRSAVAAAGADVAGADVDAGADVGAAALPAVVVGDVAVPPVPAQPDSRAARAKADRPMLKLFFIC